jgi:hypothetical protein
MQNRKDNDIITQSVEISDLPPRPPDYNFIETNESAGATTLSKEEMTNLFEGRNLTDGSPHVTPVWANIENGIILINTSEAAAKYKHILKDPRIAICVVEQYNPYNMVSIKGKVIEHIIDGADEEDFVYGILFTALSIEHQWNHRKIRQNPRICWRKQIIILHDTTMHPWFTLPNLKTSGQPPPPPPRSKMAIVVFIAAYIISSSSRSILNPLIGQIYSDSLIIKFPLIPSKCLSSLTQLL